MDIQEKAKALADAHSKIADVAQSALSDIWDMIGINIGVEPAFDEAAMASIAEIRLAIATHRAAQTRCENIIAAQVAVNADVQQAAMTVLSDEQSKAETERRIAEANAAA